MFKSRNWQNKNADFEDVYFRVYGRILVLYLPIMVFVLCGFEHCVANMSFISGGLFINYAYGNLGVDVSGLSWYNFLITNLVPVTIGNIIGGSALGTMYWFAFEKEAE